MEIWLDSSDASFVADANSFGIVDGVTTNPTIMSTSKISPQKLIGKMLEVQNGLVAVQVLSDDIEEICNQAKILFAISNRILVKIPVTQNGIRAIYNLNKQGIPTLATAIFEVRQALLAFKAGAHYLAPYLERIGDTGKDPIQILSEMQSIKLQYGFNGKIMGAGIRDLTTALACLKTGISAITLSEKVFNELVADYEPTLKALDKFSTDWSRSSYSKADLYSLNIKK